MSAHPVLSAALDRVVREEGVISGFTSRVEFAHHHVTNLSVSLETAAHTITDIDAATELANLVRLQVLQETQQVLLAQANQDAEVVLALLGGDG